MDSKKPSLMLAVMDGLKKKGKMESEPAMDEPADDDADSSREHLEQISKELIDAVHSKDPSAVADLLEEAFMCLDAQPHEEGPHLGEKSDSKY